MHKVLRRRENRDILVCAIAGVVIWSPGIKYNIGGDGDEATLLSKDSFINVPTLFYSCQAAIKRANWGVD